MVSMNGSDICIRWICPRINSAESSDTVHQNRIIELIEAMNTHAVSCVESKSLEASSLLTNGILHLVGCPESISVVGIDIKRSVVIKERLVEVPREDVFRGNAEARF